MKWPHALARVVPMGERKPQGERHRTGAALLVPAFGVGVCACLWGAHA